MKYAIPAYILSASAAFAHSGHDAAVYEGLVHWITQSDHLVVVGLGVLVGALAFGRKVMMRRAKRQEA